MLGLLLSATVWWQCEKLASETQYPIPFEGQREFIYMHDPSECAAQTTVYGNPVAEHWVEIPNGAGRVWTIGSSGKTLEAGKSEGEKD